MSINMFDFAAGRNVAESKCYVTHGTMGHLDPEQPPVKRKPYAAILSVPFVHKAELILPKELYEMIHSDLVAKFPVPEYSRVILPLSSLLEGDFFNNYIKRGDILMLSEGVYGIDNIFSLKNGVLALTLDKDSYECAGLVGKPDGVKGSRGKRPRWIVEINLRLPSMLHGKKGFDRIVYAFKNVLTSPVTWLFIDLQAQATSTAPIKEHFPVMVSCPPEVSSPLKVEVPTLQPPQGHRDMYEDEFGDFSVETYEWISLISLGSPRVECGDKIDPFLSRYTQPHSGDRNSGPTEIFKISWTGFTSSLWAHKIFVQVLLMAKPEMWFSFALLGFDESKRAGRGGCTTLRIPGAHNEYMLWEVEQG